LPPITDAWPELRALAVAMRADWRADDLRDAVLAARQGGMPFGEVAREVWRLVWDPDGEPGELRGTARRWGLAAKARPERGDYERGGALWREALEQRQGSGGGTAA
jgi:hypothetical protein